MEVPDSEGLTAGLSKKPSSSTSSTSILLEAAAAKVPNEVDSALLLETEDSSSVSICRSLLLNGVRGSLRSLQILHGCKNLGSIATSP